MSTRVCGAEQRLSSEGLAALPHLAKNCLSWKAVDGKHNNKGVFLFRFTQNWFCVTSHLLSVAYNFLSLILLKSSWGLCFSNFCAVLLVAPALLVWSWVGQRWICKPSGRARRIYTKCALWCYEASKNHKKINKQNRKDGSFNDFGSCRFCCCF